MIRVLLSLFLLEICLGSKISSSPDLHHGGRIVRNADNKTVEQPGPAIPSIINVGVNVPSFPDSVDLQNDISSSTDVFKIRYTNSTLYKLSSAYRLFFVINYDAKKIQVLLRLREAQIKGFYSVSLAVSNNKTSEQAFELDFEGNLNFTYYRDFVVENGKVDFRTAAYKQEFVYDEMKSTYTGLPARLDPDLKNYTSPELMNALLGGIFDQVRAKVSHEYEYIISRIERDIKERGT